MSEKGFSEKDLPMTAHSLCKEAFYLAIGKLNEARDEKLSSAVKMVKSLDQALTSGEIPTLNTIPDQIVNFFDFPNTIDEVEEIIPDEYLIHATEHSECYEDVSELSIYVSLLYFIMELKGKEDHFLENKNAVSYQEFMQSVDDNIHNISKALIMLKTFEPGMKQHEERVIRKAGAKKGGLAKANRTSELKEMVIDEFIHNHMTKKATDAARAILDKLGPESTWLKGETGKPISKDPQVLFTNWIREYRRKTKH